MTLREAIKQFAEIDYMEYPTAESLGQAIVSAGDMPHQVQAGESLSMDSWRLC